MIAGPTASGKSTLALEFARAQGGVIVNADALQVFADWRVLTARPSAQEEAAQRHALYGHVAWETAYSVGAWLRDVARLLDQRLIIVGGTGLYFRALTEGLVDVPPIDQGIRDEASRRLASGGLDALLADIAPQTAEMIDQQNPRRVARAWEVERATGTPLHVWHARTPPALVDPGQAAKICLEAPKDWLSPRIAQRFDGMLAQGALDEARAILPRWDPKLPAAQAIGAPELIAHLRGELSLEAARDAACLATTQYAKRQRTWFRRRMRDWTLVEAAEL